MNGVLLATSKHATQRWDDGCGAQCIVNLTQSEKEDQYGIGFCGSRKGICTTRSWHDHCPPGQDCGLGASRSIFRCDRRGLHVHVLRHL